MNGPAPEGSVKDWLGLAMVGVWFATGLVSLIALAFIPRDLTRPGRWWQVVVACILIGMVVYSAANWSP